MAATPNSSKRRQYVPRTTTTREEPKSSRRLSVFLLGIGAVVTLLVASWLGFFHNADESTLEIKDVKVAENGQIALTGARYRGVSSAGQPFNIIADKANESYDGSGQIDMQKPRASLTMKNGDVIQLVSNFGVFDQPNQHVELVGSVVVTQSGRNLQLMSEALFANLNLGELRSSVPVVVIDEKRRIDAATMNVFDHGERIVFGGKSRMVMQSSKIQTSTN